jgi:hypothetical protein
MRSQQDSGHIQKKPRQNIILDVTENQAAESSTGDIFQTFSSTVQSLFTLAYGNNEVTNKIYRNIDEAMAANDPLGAAKLYLGSNGHINLTREHRQFLGPTYACEAIELEDSGAKRAVALPRNCSKEVLDAFLYVLQHARAIAEFRIHSYGEKESYIIKAFKAFSSVTTVKRLRLEGADLATINITKALAELLSQNKTLQEICVCWNLCDTLPYLTEAMRGNTTVKELTIERSPAYNEADEVTTPSLRADDLIAFARMLETNTGLEKVSLRGANIPDNVAQAFAEAFKKNNTLKDIDLSECRISADGLKFLATTWINKKDLGGLKTIHLSGNDPNGAGYLARVKYEYNHLDIYFDTGLRCCGQRQYMPLPKPSVKSNSSMNM